MLLYTKPKGIIGVLCNAPNYLTTVSAIKNVTRNAPPSLPPRRASCKSRRIEKKIKQQETSRHVVPDATSKKQGPQETRYDPSSAGVPDARYPHQEARKTVDLSDQPAHHLTSSCLLRRATSHPHSHLKGIHV